MLVRISVFIGSLFTVLPFAILCFVPFWRHLKVSMKKFKVIAAFYILYIVALSVLNNLLSGWVVWYGQVFVFLAIIPGFAVLYLTVKSRLSKLLYVFFVVSTYAYSLGGLTNYFEARFFPQFFYGSYFYYTYTIPYIILFCVSIPWMWMFLKGNVKTAVLGDDTPVWKYMWIIPATIFAVLVIYTGIMDVEHIMNLNYLVIITLLATSSLLIYFVATKMIIQTANNAKLEQQLALQGEHYMSLQSHIEETKKARHDLRHHLQVIHSYTATGENEKLAEYLTEYTQSLPDDTEISYCENFAVNSLLRYYIGIAKKEGIQVETHLDLPENTGISDTDLCIIFGNCVENAIEACRKLKDGKFIKIHSMLTGKLLTITIDNSFDGKIKKEGDVFLSLKHEGDGTPSSGVGISSVKAVVEKYGESSHFAANGNVFQATVILRVKRE